MGAAVGWLTYGLSPTYRRRFVANAALAGVPRRDSRRAIGEAGRLLLELPYLWLRPPQARLSPPVGWEGAALIDDAHARGRGIVFLTPHLGSFEVTAQAYAERYAAAHGPITVLYRPARKPWLRQLVDTARGRPGLATAPATLAGVRQMIRALRRGEAVGLLPDQVPPGRPGRVGAVLRQAGLHDDAGRPPGAADRRHAAARLGRAPAVGPGLPPPPARLAG